MKAINIEKIKIGEGWKIALENELKSPQMQEIKAKYIEALKSNAKIYPPKDKIWEAFALCRWEDIKAVIVGQDPYHQEGQAMGLCFSVNNGVKLPASLKNIYKEIEREYNVRMGENGDLSDWARSGVLMLNSLLSVEANTPLSHKKLGWEWLTDRVIEIISREKRGIVYMLWGNYARNKKSLIAKDRDHLILEAVHPSPLAGGGFVGCGHFIKANDWIVKQGRSPIDWTIGSGTTNAKR